MSHARRVFGGLVAAAFCASIAFGALCAEAKNFRLVLRRYNDKSTYVLYDADSDPSEGNVMHVRTSDGADGNPVAWLVDVKGNPVAAAVVGETTYSHEYVMGPIGCSDTVDSNCAKDSIDAKNKFLRLMKFWYLSKNSAECLSQGGDDASCLGPMTVVTDEGAKTSDITPHDLLVARGIFIVSGFLEGCGAPLVTRVDMILPSLVVDTGCGDFSGSYTSVNRDAYSGFLVNTTEVFSKSDFQQAQHRVLVRRYDDVWVVQFADADGVGFDEGFYNVRYSSLMTLSDPSEFPPLNTSVEFYVDNVTTCFATFSIDESNIDPPQLNLPERPDDTNYMFSKRDPLYYTSMGCGYHVGERDENGQLKYPGTPEGVPGGCDVIFATGSLPRIPIFVPPNPAYGAYRLDCVDFYPFGPTFNGFGLTGRDGQVFDRIVAAQHRCFAPLLIPEFILDNTDPSEKARQCFFIGGVLAGPTGDACARRITKADCHEGFLPAGEHCYYKFDVTKEAFRKTPQSEAGSIARQILPLLADVMEVVPSTNPYLKAWMMNHFLYWKRDVFVNADEVFEYRIPVSGDLCECYGLNRNVVTDPFDDETYVRSCSCNEPNLPLLRYHQKYYDVIDKYILMSPRTIQTLRDGQWGAPWSGQPLQCSCFDGYGGAHGEIPICPFPTSDVSDNPLVEFHRKCNANRRGRCRNGDSRRCVCDERYGPDASLLPSAFPEAADIPCSCPVAPSDDPLFAVGNATYESNILQRPQNVPCSGKSHGTCVVDPFSNAGECTCATRVRISADEFSGITENQYTGASCACREPRLSSTADIVQKTCNGKGPCCPFGETIADATGIPAKCPPGASGCLCTVSGFTGESCTCDAPIDLVDSRPIASTDPADETRHIVDFGVPTKIKMVHVKSKTSTLLSYLLTNTSRLCVPTRVFVTDSKISDVPIAECYRTGYPEAMQYYCGEDTFAQFVIVMSARPTQACDVAVYEDFFPPNGNNTNPHAGRFSANAKNRGFLNYQELQPLQYASYGCTNG